VPAVVVALAGCGSSDDFSPDVVARAADKTASAGGARMALTTRVQGQTLRGNGFVDTKGRKARLRLTLPGAGEMETIFVNRVIYLRFPEALSNQVPGGKQWLKLDLERFGKAKGIDLGALAGQAGSDPTSQLDQLRGAGDVKKVGTETVRGVETTHYTATIDLRKAADKAPASQRAAARRSVENVIKLTGQSTVPVEVWIDDAGRLRRQKVTQQVKGEPVTATIELYDFGAREAVEPPPASETSDITDLAGKQGG
jgi:hypothetical protein